MSRPKLEQGPEGREGGNHMGVKVSMPGSPMGV